MLGELEGTPGCTVTFTNHNTRPETNPLPSRTQAQMQPCNDVVHSDVGFPGVFR